MGEENARTFVLHQGPPIFYAFKNGGEFSPPFFTLPKHTFLLLILPQYRSQGIRHKSFACQ